VVIGRRQYVNLRAVNLIRDHSFKSMVYGAGACVTLSLSLAVTLLVLGDSLRTITNGYLTVLFEPFALPLFAFALFGGLFVSIIGAVSIAREREMGTLETLFYGPVKHQDYLLGKFLGPWQTYITLLAIFLIACFILSWLTQLRISTAIVLIAVFSIFPVGALIALGLLIATFSRTTRATILFFGGLVLFLLLLQGGDALLTNAVSSGSLTGLVFFRDTLTLVDNIVVKLSPASYLVNGVMAVLGANWGEAALQIGIATAYGLAAIILATVTLRRKGVGR
jgi:ribosome-dependent ATPase